MKRRKADFPKIKIESNSPSIMHRAETLFFIVLVLIFLVLFCIFYIDHMNSRKEVEDELKHHKSEATVDPSEVFRTKFTLKYERNGSRRIVGETLKSSSEESQEDVLFQ